MCRSRSHPVGRTGILTRMDQTGAGRSQGTSTLIGAAWAVVIVCIGGLLLQVFVMVNSSIADTCQVNGVYAVGGPQGTAGWSWLPPGQTCTYEVTVGDWPTAQVVTQGSWYLVSTILLLIVCVALLVHLRRVRRAIDPAGWYPDQDGAGSTRYWDGHAWADADATQPRA